MKEFNIKTLLFPGNFIVVMLSVMTFLASMRQLFIAANLRSGFGGLPLLFLATVGLSLAMYFLLSALTQKKKSLANTLVSSLILYLLLFPPVGTMEVLLIVLATVITTMIKFFGEVQGKPLVNPAAGGILFVLVLAHFFAPNAMFFAQWWGASFGTLFEIYDIKITLSLFLIFIWIFFGLAKWRRIPIFVTFLTTKICCDMFFAFLAPDFSKQLTPIFNTYIDSTIYFFAAVMLVEPKTSPSVFNQQLVFGALAGILLSVMNAEILQILPRGLTSFLSGANYFVVLVMVNVGFFCWSRWMEKNRTKISTRQTAIQPQG